MKKRLIALLCAVVMVMMIVPQVFAAENSGEVRLTFFYMDKDNTVSSYSYLLEQSDLPYTVPATLLDEVNSFVGGDFKGKWYRNLDFMDEWHPETPITETTYLYAPGYDRESIEYYVKVEFNYDTVGMDDNWDEGDLDANENEMLEDVFKHENPISSVNDEIVRIKDVTEKIFGGWYTSEQFKPETKIDPKNFYINEQTVNYIKDSMGYLTVYAKWLDPAHVEKASLLPRAQAKFSPEEIRVRFIWDFINPGGETITSIGAYLIPA